ncbi:MAG: hypothetical protein AB7P40_06380 [Chloroflexota bacterium]
MGVAPGRSAARLLLRELGPLVVLALCSLILFRDDLFTGSIFSERDTELFYLPLVRWYLEHWRAGQLPLWIPLIFDGYPLFADGEMGMLYPLNMLLGYLAGPDGFIQVSRAVHLFLGGAFMLAFMRVLGAGQVAALIGGLVFGFGSFLVAQIQHENVVRSAVWLPLVLLCVELAFREIGWRRQQWLVAGGLALAMAALGVHIQPVFMTLVCLGLFVVYRVVVGPVRGRWWERLLLLVWAPALVTGIGLGVAAAQWLPLYELGRMSYRGPGLGYDLATTWPLRWQNLATIVLPYLFRLPDGRWVTLWQQWESFIYVGIVPLGLALIGGLLGRLRIAPFFVLLAVFGLLVGLAEQSPLNIHRLLWSLPGFSSLRAPGRYAYIIVFALAALSAFGMDYLMRLRRRSWPAAAVALLFSMGVGGVIYLILGLHRRLLADPVRWKKLIDDYYLSVWHEHEWLSGDLVYRALVDGLDVTNPKTAWSIGLLIGAALLLLAWALLPRLSSVWASITVIAVAADLLIFGYDYHPHVPISQLIQPSPVAAFLGTLGPDARVFADSSLRFLEPNTLLKNEVPTVAGYASLGTQRHFEYWSSVDNQEDALLDLWSVRQVVMAVPPRDVQIVEGTAYRPYNALFRGAASNLTGYEEFAIEPFRTVEMRVLSTLVDGVQVDQDTPVAEITLISRDGARESVQLLAGVHTAENAYDRPDVQPHLRHARPPVAGKIPDTDPSGLPTQTNVYLARFPVDALEVVGIEMRQLYPVGHTRIFGVGLVNQSGEVHSLFSSDRAKFRPVWSENGITVLENRQAFPRAYVVPEGIRRTRADESALLRMSSRPFDGTRQVILEEGPFDALPLVRPRLGQPLDPHAMPRAATVTDLSTKHVQIQTPDGPGGFLVLTDLYHRGWRARIDGQPTPVYLANFLFRAVYLPPGPHVVEFAFDPLSLRIGIAVSAATLLFALVVGAVLPLVAGWRGRRI